MRICVLGNLSRTVYIFWRVLMEEARRRGHEVEAWTPAGDGESDARLRDMGVEVLHYRLDRKGVNPLRDLVTFLDLERLLKARRPDLLFATTIKPVIYGCLAARRARIPQVYATITGLGYAFERDSLPKRLVHAVSVELYKSALSQVDGVFFQNGDDAELFRSLGILGGRARVLFARGTGVDTERFALQPWPEGEETIFIVVARLLVAKGLRDFAEAAGRVKARHPSARFQILGPRETGFGSVPPEEIEAWAKGGVVEYLGETDDVRPYVRAAKVCVLPSWREGTPTSVMEAMSMGRACVVTDVPGCRELVRDGVNGLLVPPKDPGALARAMERLILEPGLAAEMGARGREAALSELDARVVADGVLNDMRIPRPSAPDGGAGAGRTK